jgi:Aminoglycoside-2''-adenylyltransferase
VSAPPPVDAWSAWTPAEVASRLSGVDAPWYVVGGWAIDLWLGGETRPHHDVEIAVPRSHFADIRTHLGRDFVLYANGGGTMRQLAPADPFPRDKNQCWVRDGDVWRLDVMLDPGDTARWVFRRDERIAEPRERMIRRSPSGLPYLAPEAVLLFKAKGARPKDEADFDTALPLLEPEARAWLTAALATTAPGHPWLARLAA